MATRSHEDHDSDEPRLHAHVAGRARFTIKGSDVLPSGRITIALMQALPHVVTSALCMSERH